MLGGSLIADFVGSGFQDRTPTKIPQRGDDLFLVFSHDFSLLQLGLILLIDQSMFHSVGIYFEYQFIGSN